MQPSPKEIVTSLLSGVVGNPASLWEALTSEWLGPKAWTQVNVMLDMVTARLSKSNSRTDFPIEFPLTADDLEKISEAEPQVREFWSSALLLDRGANPWTFLSSQNAFSAPANCAVQRWAARGWLSLVRQSWDHPARLRDKSEEDFWASSGFQDLLVPAISTNQLALVKFYVEKGCPLNCFVPGRETSALRHAATPAMARFLLEQGADPDLPDEGGFNPIERWAIDRKDSLLEADAASQAKISALVEVVWQHCAKTGPLDRPAFRSYPVVLALLREFKRLKVRAPLAPYGWGCGPSPSIHLPAATPLGMIAVLAGQASPLPLSAWPDAIRATQPVANQVPPSELLQAWMALSGVYAALEARGAMSGRFEQLRHQVADMIVQPDALDEVDVEMDWSQAVDMWSRGLGLRQMRSSLTSMGLDRVAFQWLNFLEVEPRAIDMAPSAEAQLFSSLLKNSSSFRSNLLQLLSNPKRARAWWTARAGEVPSYLFSFSATDQKVVLETWSSSGAPVRLGEQVRSRLPHGLSPAVRSWVDQAILDQDLPSAPARPRPRI